MQKLIKKYRKAKGFTLVELLIVIIIIGILAGMMMLSTGSATDKAEATKIVSDMRNIKSAALMYYADNGNWFVPANDTEVTGSSLDKYLDGSNSSKTVTYKVSPGSTSDDKMIIKASGFTSAIGEKLKDFDVVSVDAGGTSAQMTLK